MCGYCYDQDRQNPTYELLKELVVLVLKRPADACIVQEPSSASLNASSGDVLRHEQRRVLDFQDAKHVAPMQRVVRILSVLGFQRLHDLMTASQSSISTPDAANHACDLNLACVFQFEAVPGQFVARLAATHRASLYQDFAERQATYFHLAGNHAERLARASSW